ncbi:MAG TPA: methyltransferase domain-containing protein [Longimicrobium sp.]|uniref:class I SAM-dependent methyltransferase n=1 Tax=Longimicrobium sp. TaxID=2029185 RepID=UPI002EDB4FBA
MTKIHPYDEPKLTLPRRVVRRVRYELGQAGLTEQWVAERFGTAYLWRRRLGVRLRPSAAPQTPLRSSLCRQDQLESPAFRAWAARMGQPFQLHRKVWEFCYIAQALDERGMLQPDRRGLGFAVGHEPLPALFASMGCDVLATDLAAEQAQGTGWIETNQHASSLADLNLNGVCPPEAFARQVSFRPVDMNAIPADLSGFDFLWSSCSLEHLGSLRHGAEFIYNAMRCLRPGGVAVHTTEYNASSNGPTVRTGGAVIFRRRDLRAIAAELRAAGHDVAELDFTEGTLPADLHVDRPPFTHNPHLRLSLDGHVATSFGLIVRKAEASSGLRIG